MTENYQDALEDLNSSILKDAFFAQAYTVRGHIKHIMGELVGAEKDYSKSLEIQPSDSLTLHHRAKT